MSSSSKSEQTSQQSTASYDQRIANESGIVVGPGGTYTQNFPTQAVDIVSKVLDFSGGVIKNAGNIVDESIKSSEAAAQGLITSNRQLQTQSQLGNAGLLPQIIPVLVIGAIGLVIFLGFRKGR